MKQGLFVADSPRGPDGNVQTLRLPFSRPAKRPPPGPDDTLLYAIGDIHGRSDLLDVLMDSIRADRAYFPGKDARVIFLGDYVDRGPDSSGVIDRLIAVQQEAAFVTVALRGNHEQYLMSFLGDPEAHGSAGWLEYGGRETLASYGIKAPGPKADAQEWGEVGAALRLAMPPEHASFLDSTVLSAEFGSYVFVHAGVRPGVSLGDQQADDMTMIRKPFLQAKQPLEDRVVVFGHTVFEKPLVERWKVGLDTGAFASGTLTALKVDGPQWYFCST